MPTRNRETLRHYFREGALPTQDHFADLVDSMLNMKDEGFRKTVEHGFEVYAPLGHDALISFFRDQSSGTALWEIGLSSAQDQLLIQSRESPRDDDVAADVTADAAPSADGPTAPLLCLDAHQRIGIATTAPQAQLDVAGTVRSSGRQGSLARRDDKPIPADGQWHDLTDDLEGCQAFEVVAGAGCRGAGRYGLVHAIAMNTYNPTLGLFDFLNRKRGIRCTHGYYSRRCDRLELRWSGSSGAGARYRLQIRTGCSFGANIRIQTQLTQLWFDPHMRRGQP